jgi:hypothetical protein
MRRMSHRAARTCALLALAAAALCADALPLPAQEAAAVPGNAVYNVEIIVFRASGALGEPEDWSAEAGARSIAGAEAGGDSAQIGHFVAALPSSAWQLTELENRLRASGTYVPVAHGDRKSVV